MLEDGVQLARQAVYERFATSHRARHLFSQHCRAIPAPMSHLRIAGGIHQQSWERSPGFPTSQTEPEGNPWSRPRSR
jgi:hypothetical protein